MRSLTITQPVDDQRSFDVRVGDLWEDGLTQDEALWVTAQFLMGKPHQYLKSDDEHAAFSAQLKRIREQRDTPENIVIQ